MTTPTPAQQLPPPPQQAQHARRCAALHAAISAGVFDPGTTTTRSGEAGGEGEGSGAASAIFLDEELLHATVAHLAGEAGYPATALHTFAVKANPTGRLLEALRDRGMGAEVGICVGMGPGNRTAPLPPTQHGAAQRAQRHWGLAQ